MLSTPNSMIARQMIELRRRANRIDELETILAARDGQLRDLIAETSRLRNTIRDLERDLAILGDSYQVRSNEILRLRESLSVAIHGAPDHVVDADAEPPPF